MDADCKALFERVSEYLDGELEPAVCQKIEEHIKDCPQCEDCFEALRKTVGVCRDLPHEDVSEDIRLRLRNALKKLLEDQAKLR